MKWALRDKHYLNVVGTEYEYRETGNTGKQKRVIHPVPMYLNPNDVGDWTHPELMSIVVAHAPCNDPRALIFTGPPTAEMEPLDDEAREASAAESKRWVHPIETLSGVYADKVVQAVEDMMSLRASQPPVARDREAELEAQNAALAAQLAALQEKAEPSQRRV